MIDQKDKWPYNYGYSQGEHAMYKYQVWVRINDLQTANTYVWASDDYQAKMIAESQYGHGNVLNYTRVYE